MCGVTLRPLVSLSRPRRYWSMSVVRTEMDGVGTTHSSLQDCVKPLVDLRPDRYQPWACVSTNLHIFFIQISSCMELDPSAHHRVNCFHRFHLLPSWFASQLSASAPWCHHHSSRSFPILGRTFSLIAPFSDGTFSLLRHPA